MFLFLVKVWGFKGWSPFKYLRWAIIFLWSFFIFCFYSYGFDYNFNWLKNRQSIKILKVFLTFWLINRFSSIARFSIFLINPHACIEKSIRVLWSISEYCDRSTAMLETKLALSSFLCFYVAFVLLSNMQ